MNSIGVKADWDLEAEVWTATSSDVPGLLAQSSSLEKLRPKVLAMIEDLIEEAVVSFEKGEIAVHIVANVTERLQNPVAV